MLSLARGSFWYKCPFVPLIVRKFSPLPPSPSSHTHSTSFTRTHTIPSYHEQVSYERRNHLRLFRLGLTRVLSFDFLVWMGHLNTIPNCHSGTYSIWGLTISLKIKIFELRFLKRIRHRETTPTPFDGGTRAKQSNLYPSQGEKECAACLLMIKLHIKDTCSDCSACVWSHPARTARLTPVWLACQHLWLVRQSPRVFTLSCATIMELFWGAPPFWMFLRWTTFFLGWRVINLWLVYFDEKANVDVEVTMPDQLGGWVGLEFSYNTVVGHIDSFTFHGTNAALSQLGSWTVSPGKFRWTTM